MDLTILAAKLAEIRERFTSLVEQINMAAGGEPFYGRIFLSRERRIIGLINDLRISGYKIVFTFIEERLVKGKIKRKVSRKKLPLEEIRGIEVFRTISGKPMFIAEK